MKELAEEQLVQFDRTSSYRDLTSALFVTAGVSPAETMELDNIDAAKKMVEQGFGVALLPQTSVADELEAGTLAEVEVVDASPVRRKIVAITRRDAGPPAGQPRRSSRPSRRSATSSRAGRAARRKASSRGRATSTAQSSGPRSAPVSARRSAFRSPPTALSSRRISFAAA